MRTRKMGISILGTAVVGALITGFSFHYVSAKAASYTSIKPLIMGTKAGKSTVGKFLNDVLPRFQNSYWGAPVRLPGSMIEPLIYSAFQNTNNGNATAAFMLFDIKGGRVYAADQISQAILKGDFPTAYALMVSGASGAVDDGNGDQLFTNAAPIFAGNVSAYAAMAALRNGSVGRGGEAGIGDRASDSADSGDAADAVSDGGGR